MEHAPQAAAAAGGIVEALAPRPYHIFSELDDVETLRHMEGSEALDPDVMLQLNVKSGEACTFWYTCRHFNDSPRNAHTVEGREVFVIEASRRFAVLATHDTRLTLKPGVYMRAYGNRTLVLESHIAMEANEVIMNIEMPLAANPSGLYMWKVKCILKKQALARIGTLFASITRRTEVQIERNDVTEEINFLFDLEAQAFRISNDQDAIRDENGFTLEEWHPEPPKRIRVHCSRKGLVCYRGKYKKGQWHCGRCGGFMS